MSELDQLISYYKGLLVNSRGLLTRPEHHRIYIVRKYLEELRKLKGA